MEILIWGLYNFYDGDDDSELWLCGECGEKTDMLYELRGILMAMCERCFGLNVGGL